MKLSPGLIWGHSMRIKHFPQLPFLLWSRPCQHKLEQRIYRHSVQMSATLEWYAILHIPTKNSKKARRNWSVRLQKSLGSDSTSWCQRSTSCPGSCWEFHISIELWSRSGSVSWGKGNIRFQISIGSGQVRVRAGTVVKVAESQD